MIYAYNMFRLVLCLYNLYVFVDRITYPTHKYIFATVSRFESNLVLQHLKQNHILSFRCYKFHLLY